MIIDILIEKKILSKEQAEYLKDNNYIIKKKKKLSFNNMNFVNIVKTMTEKIIDNFKFNLNMQSNLYDILVHSKKEETEKAISLSKEEIGYLLETLLETVTDYIPSFKKEWSGTILNKRTIEAIKKRKLFELVYYRNGDLLLCDYSLLLNKKTANAVCLELNDGKKSGKYRIVERDIK